MTWMILYIRLNITHKLSFFIIFSLETQPNDEFILQEEGHDTLQDSQDSYNNKIIAQNLVSESSNKILLAEFIYKNIEKLNEKLERDLQKLNMEQRVFQEKDKVLELKDLLEKTLQSIKEERFNTDNMNSTQKNTECRTIKPHFPVTPLND